MLVTIPADPTSPHTCTYVPGCNVLYNVVSTCRVWLCMRLIAVSSRDELAAMQALIYMLFSDPQSKPSKVYCRTKPFYDTPNIIP